MAKKQNLQDWYDDYLEDEEIIAEVEAQLIRTAQEFETTEEYRNYLADLDKKEVLPNSDVSQ